MPLNITAAVLTEESVLCDPRLGARLLGSLHTSLALNLGSDFSFLFQPYEIIKIITILHITYHESGISSVYLIDWLLLSYRLSLTDSKEESNFKYIHTYTCYVYACKFMYVCI